MFHENKEKIWFCVLVTLRSIFSSGVSSFAHMTLGKSLGILFCSRKTTEEIAPLLISISDWRVVGVSCQKAGDPASASQLARVSAESWFMSRKRWKNLTQEGYREHRYTWCYHRYQFFPVYILYGSRQDIYRDFASYRETSRHRRSRWEHHL